MSEYIKRDDVIDLLEQVINAEEFFDTDNAKAQSDLALWFEERISELPKADVEPVRHGRWLRAGQSFIDPNKFLCFECSICRCTLDNHIKLEPNYCPNCGAKMDGEEQKHV